MYPSKWRETLLSTKDVINFPPVCIYQDQGP